jgi:biotin carboxyl carrier protein
MKLQAEIEGVVRDVEIRIDGGLVFARVEDREYKLEVSEPELNVYLLKHDGRIFEVLVGNMNAEGPTPVNIRGVEVAVSVIDRKRLRGSAADNSHGDDDVEIRTAMPGKVVRVLSAVGDKVKKGGGVVVVEAMKMQNEMRAPRDATVKEIRVSEGETVNAGQLLVLLG